MALTTGEGALYTALSYIVFEGFLAMLLKNYDGKEVVFDDLFSIDNRWISFTFTSLIKGMLIFVGLLLFVVPRVYLAVRWLFAELLVIDKGMRPMEALKASSEMTKGHMWKPLWFFYSFNTDSPSWCDTFVCRHFSSNDYYDFCNDSRL